MVSTVQDKSASGGKAEHLSNVLSLPSHLFFVRGVDLPPGISQEELPSFVELTLEQISPFALNQLYYGYYLPPEGSRLLLFAAYRKQLAVYEDETWTTAELVLPGFASALGMSREGPTLVFLRDDQDLTAIYWAAGSAVPDRVLSRTIDPLDGEVTEEQAREELRGKIGPLPDRVNVRLLTDPRGKIHDRDLVFALREEAGDGEVSVEIPRADRLSMDVRDKAFLTATRKVQRQNRWLWSGVLLATIGFAALALFEVALFAGRQVLNSREARIQSLEPEVNKIRQEEELATRLEELSGERLLPFEMLAFLNDLRPPSIYFTRVETVGLRSFRIEALTPKSQDVDRFQRRLEDADPLESVEIRGLRLRAQDGRSSFTLEGTFEEAALAGSLLESSPNGTAPGLELPRENPPPPADAPPPDEPTRETMPMEALEREPSGREELYEPVPLPDVPVGDVPVGGEAETREGSAPEGGESNSDEGAAR